MPQLSEFSWIKIFWILMIIFYLINYLFNFLFSSLNVLNNFNLMKFNFNLFI